MPAVPSNLIDNSRVKLGRLRDQIDAAAGSEHPNNDSRLAVLDLGGQTDRLIRRLSDFEKYPDNIRFALLRQTNYFIYNVTDLLGFLVRATSTRNLFELYYPMLEISKKLVDNDVHLILSSDWQFSPFTYPFNLDQLPNYILIGLPASESENVLLFPTAAHELGHNIWKARSINSNISNDLEEIIFSEMEKTEADFIRIYGAKGVQIRTDMFAQPIVRRCINFAMRQLEEVFCDYTAFIIFGQSYIYSFDYLLAPSLGGRRDGEYPSSKARVEYMERHAKTLDVDIEGLSKRFSEEDMPSIEEISYTIKIADRATAILETKIFEICIEYIHSRLGKCHSIEGRRMARASFINGIPTSANVSFGDVLNAAWEIYNSSTEKGLIEAKGVSLVPFITDLVIKSLEVREYRSYISRA